ncbi:MAG: tRNA3(Ser)-specific nuclease WapA precursor [Verrucomicrobia bacterium ADurb.Bin118]|nr:MAG: tRNA3(Ser)-specific nuclease WapA precursor [Verrucomicrobia bacterium ADurb.Bin118]
MTYNADNQIATFNGVTYDADGNLTSGPLTNNMFVSYTYDARNRLLSAGGLNYGYDPSANRVAITNGANVTRFVVNPNAALSQVLVRTKPDGSKTFYVYGVGLLYEVNETAGGVETSTRTYHYDYRGSTVALTDGNGNVTARIEYSPYGTTTYRTGNTDTPFLFNGRYGVQTDANGLLYMRARYYNPYLCRFLNPDPSGFTGGLNFYAYADGNPVSLIDPFGLWSWSQTFGVARAVGGVFETAAGVGLAAATSPTGVGAVGGGLVALHGLDQIQAGFRQAWSGGHVDSLTSSGLQAAGMSPTAANLTDAGISIVGSFGAGFATQGIRATELAATSISAEVQNASLLAKIGYYEVGQLSVKGNALEAYSLWGNTLDRGAAMVADQGGGFFGGAKTWWEMGSRTMGASEGTLFGWVSNPSIQTLYNAWPTPLGAGTVGALGGVANWSSTSIGK